MTKSEEEKGKGITTIVKRRLRINAEIPLDTQESGHLVSQDSQCQVQRPLGRQVFLLRH